MPPISKDGWNSAVYDSEDIQKVLKVGLMQYSGLMGKSASPEDDWPKQILSSFASILKSASSTMDRTTLEEIKHNWEGKGPFIEPALWEDPRYTIRSNLTLDSQIILGGIDPLLELLVIGNNLESFVRPNLLRLLWCCERCMGKETEYSGSQLDQEDRQGSIGYALNRLKELSRNQKNAPMCELIDEKTSEFIDSLEDLDYLRNCIMHRDFCIRNEKVVLGFHPHPGKREEYSWEQLAEIRLRIMGLVCLLKAFQAMFSVHLVARVKDVSPYEF